MKILDFKKAASVLVAAGIGLGGGSAHARVSDQQLIKESLEFEVYIEPEPGDQMTMGGYVEDSTHFLDRPRLLTLAEKDRAKYLKDKVELEKAIQDCDARKKSCVPQ